ncbi:MAG: hypothetical protein QM668_19340 [Agriterribacter sp.]
MMRKYLALTACMFFAGVFSVCAQVSLQVQNGKEDLKVDTLPRKFLDKKDLQQINFLSHKGGVTVTMPNSLFDNKSIVAGKMPNPLYNVN